MSRRYCPFSARPASCALLLLLGQVAGSPRYELLRTLEEEGAAGSLSLPSSGGSQAVGGTMSLGGTGSGGNSAGGGSASSGSDSGGYTSGGACPAAPLDCPGPCEHGFQPLLLARKGCAVCECIPPSECASSSDCPSDEVCYAGAQCQDGCSDPTCCFGNRCSKPGCGVGRPSLCLAFGCSDGGSCLAACDATSCECDGADWACENTTGGAPVASCPPACAPP